MGSPIFGTPYVRPNGLTLSHKIWYGNTYVGLVDEFDKIKRWAAQNHMVINLQKTKELVFRRRTQPQACCSSSAP